MIVSSFLTFPFSRDPSIFALLCYFLFFFSLLLQIFTHHLSIFPSCFLFLPFSSTFSLTFQHSLPYYHLFWTCCTYINRYCILHLSPASVKRRAKNLIYGCRVRGLSHGYTIVLEDCIFTFRYIFILITYLLHQSA